MTWSRILIFVFSPTFLQLIVQHHVSSFLSNVIINELLLIFVSRKREPDNSKRLRVLWFKSGLLKPLGYSSSINFVVISPSINFLLSHRSLRKDILCLIPW